MVLIDSSAVSAAYDDVRLDSSSTTWAAFNYDENTIKLLKSGEDYDDLFRLFSDEERLFAYVRIETGDEMSKRAKFAFITWIGKDLSTLKKAKMSTDKAFVKQVCSQFGIEVLAETREELQYEKLKELLTKAGGAAYGVGTR